MTTKPALDQKGLKPCPFCGGEAELCSNAAKGLAWVSCTRCMAESGGFEDVWSMDRLRDAAAQEWNRRAYLSTVIPAEIAGVVERLRDKYTEWNNPPSDGLPWGAEVMLEAATLIERLAASQAETRRLALEEAATLAAAFADSEEVEAIAGLLESNGVGSPGWRKDAMHSHAQEVSERISTAIRALIDQPSTEGGMDEGR